MPNNEEPKRLKPEQTKAILDLRERIEQKEFERDILERFPKDAFEDHVKLSCGHWAARHFSSSIKGQSICFRCIEAESKKGIEE